MERPSSAPANRYSSGSTLSGVGLNIDDFHNEILMAENYLQTANDRFVNRRSENTESEYHNEEAVDYEETEQQQQQYQRAPYLDDERRSDILRKFGREPLQARRSVSREREERAQQGQETPRNGTERIGSGRAQAWVDLSDERQRGSSTAALGKASRGTTGNRKLETDEGEVTGAYEEMLALKRLKQGTRYASHPLNSEEVDEEEGSYPQYQQQGGLDSQDQDEDSLGDTDGGTHNEGGGGEESSGVLFFASDLRNSSSSPRSRTLLDSSPITSPQNSASSARVGSRLGSGDAVTARRQPASNAADISANIGSYSTNMRGSQKVTASFNSQQQQQQQQPKTRPSSAPRQHLFSKPATTATNINNNTTTTNNTSNNRASSAIKPRSSRYDHLTKQPAHKTAAQSTAVTVPSSVPTRTRGDILERVEQMRREHEIKLALRDKQKQDFEQMEMMECTFKPKISSG